LYSHPAIFDRDLYGLTLQQLREVARVVAQELERALDVVGDGDDGGSGLGMTTSTPVRR
jgi:hypothetical protein